MPLFAVSYNNVFNPIGKSFTFFIFKDRETLDRYKSMRESSKDIPSSGLAFDEITLDEEDQQRFLNEVNPFTGMLYGEIDEETLSRVEINRINLEQFETVFGLTLLVVSSHPLNWMKRLCFESCALH